MKQDNFWNWFWGEAGAGWVFGFAGIIIVIMPFVGFIFRSMVKAIIEENLKEIKSDLNNIEKSQNETANKLSALKAEMELFIKTWNK